MTAAPPVPRIGEVVTVDGAGFGLLTIPKVAATSMRAALLTSFGHELRPREQVHHHPALKRVTFAEWTAAFVRHPLDRLVSCWADRIRGDRPSVPLRKLGYSVDTTFPEFVQAVEAVGTQRDVHTATQASHLKAGWSGGLLGRFENLTMGWKHLREITGIGPLPHLQSSKRGHWSEYYDARTEALARRLYADDLELLGYA